MYLGKRSSMESKQEKAMSIVMLPYLAHGHVSPFYEIAKKLSNKGFHFYLCSTPVCLEPIRNNHFFDDHHPNKLSSSNCAKIERGETERDRERKKRRRRERRKRRRRKEEERKKKGKRKKRKRKEKRKEKGKRKSRRKTVRKTETRLVYTSFRKSFCVFYLNLRLFEYFDEYLFTCIFDLNILNILIKSIFDLQRVFEKKLFESYNC
ncbi:hypothetical protein ACOSQ2_031164 [Xanthoceras sorbifolium]